MAKRPYPTNVIKKAQTLLTGWDQMSPVPAFGTLTIGSLNSEVTAAMALEKQVAALEVQLAEKRVQRDAHFKILWEDTKRVRNSIKGSFGDDSLEYKIVGGTRLSDRKPSRRKSTE